MSLSTRTKGAALHWNGPALRLTGCDGSQCERTWEAIRRWHKTPKSQGGPGYRDIAYSFGVCPGCGRRHQGRGWGVRTAANGTKAANDDWHAFMVMFGQGEPLTDAAKVEVLNLSAEHRALFGRMTLTTHRIVRGGTTACPGPAAIRWVADGAPHPDPPPAGYEEDDVKIIHIAELNMSFIGAPGRAAVHIRNSSELRQWRDDWAPEAIEIRWQTRAALEHYFPGTKIPG